MNNKLRTFRGDARMLHLCFEKQKLNRILMSFMVLFLMSSVGANAQALGNALDFDGTDDYVSFSNTIPDFILSTGTVETWIKTTDAGTGFRGIVTKEHAYGILLQDNEIGILSWGAPFVGAGIYANDGNWHHIVVTFQENVVNGTKLYYDGNLVLTATVGTYWWGHVNSNLKIGRNTAAQSFAGQIDEVRVWNDIRTLSEIQNNKDAELEKRSAIKWVHKFPKNVPILLLHGNSDWRVKPGQSLNLALEFEKHRIPYRLIMFEGGDHGISEFNNEVDEQVMNWFERYLKNEVERTFLVLDSYFTKE